DRRHHLVCEALGWHRPGAQRRHRRRTGRVPRRGVQPVSHTRAPRPGSGASRTPGRGILMPAGGCSPAHTRQLFRLLTAAIQRGLSFATDSRVSLPVLPSTIGGRESHAGVPPTESTRCGGRAPALTYPAHAAAGTTPTGSAAPRCRTRPCARPGHPPAPPPPPPAGP